MRIALLADIHGNLPALEAVMQQLELLQPDQVVLDGDLINGTPFSRAVVDIVRRQEWAVVRGNHEFYYLDFGTERAPVGCEDPQRWGQLHWLVEEITTEQGIYLAMLPDERTLYLPGHQPVCVAHGVPGRNRSGFHSETPAAVVAAELDGIRAPTVVSAHTHVQVDRLIAHPGCGADNQPQAAAKNATSHWHLINPGSVGMPLNGDPRAQFAIIESAPQPQGTLGWQASFYATPYDRRPVLEAFAESGMAAAGGGMAELFYWQIVTAQPEIPFFFRWAYEHGLDPDCALDEVFHAYIEATRRDQRVHVQDPLFDPHSQGIKNR
jgi:predicted phosphodiesterase